MKVVVSYEILEEDPSFHLCNVIGVIVREKSDTVIIDFGRETVEVKKKYVQNLRKDYI